MKKKNVHNKTQKKSNTNFQLSSLNNHKNNTPNTNITILIKYYQSQQLT